MPSLNRRSRHGQATKFRSRIARRRLFCESLESRRMLAAGVLDATFGSGGLVTTDLTGSDRVGGTAVDIQSDGKIVAGGFTRNGNTDFDSVVARYNPDGTPDIDFGNGGLVQTDIVGKRGRISDVLVDAEGRILAAGGMDVFVLSRYTADGALDLTFGLGGMSIGGSTQGITEIALQQDGKIVASASQYDGSTGLHDFAAIRFNCDGTLDSTFGSGGIAVAEFGLSERPEGLAIDALGRILVAGVSRDGAANANNFAVTRFLSDGSVDTSFGDDGITIIDAGGINDFARDIAIAANGDILLSGQGYNSSTGSDYVLIRLQENGLPDATFGNSGIVNTDFGSIYYEKLLEIKTLPDGKIVGVGSGNAGRILRYLPDGTLDNSFGVGGSTAVDFTDGVDSLNDVSVLADGSAVAIGVNPNPDGDPPAFIALAKFVGDNSDPQISSEADVEFAENSTDAMIVSAEDPDVGQTVAFSLTGLGSDQALFSITPTGELSFAEAPDFETPLDANGDNTYEVEVLADDGNGGTATQLISVTVLNQASITGNVFVDVNTNALFDANEIGVDGVLVRLLDTAGNPVLDSNNQAIEAITEHGGLYLFDDLDPGDYRLQEVQPTGVVDGAETLGSLGGVIVENDLMQLTLDRSDASDYYFAEIGGQVASGETATIGFWQNKHGQDLIASGGASLASWLTVNFGNVFGNTFTDGSGSDNGVEVANFYKAELFKQKSQKSAGPAKVDAQFMATALAAFFTSSNLAGVGAATYGFSVTDTGLGTRIVNVGSSGAAFGVTDGSELTVLQLLQATNSMTDQPDSIAGAARIYDTDGSGEISDIEADLRTKADLIYSLINELGDI